MISSAATVQLASRLCDHADAGSIVVSGVVQDLAIGKGYAFGTAPETVFAEGVPRTCADQPCSSGAVIPAAAAAS